MTKAQIETALRLVFGDELSTMPDVVGKLFESFDSNRTDKMDWRSFLVLLSLLMQPTLSTEEMLQ